MKIRQCFQISGISQSDKHFYKKTILLPFNTLFSENFYLNQLLIFKKLENTAKVFGSISGTQHQDPGKNRSEK